MTSFAAHVRGLTGWRRRGVAVAAGVASVLALAPFFLWPVLFLTIPVLVWLIDGALLEATGAGSTPLAVVGQQPAGTKSRLAIAARHPITRAAGA